MPFDAMVEVGGALGPSFEAQAVNLSEEGMSLRTAYLPEVGQPVMCRFEAGHGMTVVAAGEVLWNEDMGNGGEFGIRFTNLDAASTVALQRILGMAEDGGPPAADPGRKVRLHIEGLASPMRARIKDQMVSGVTAYSELGFLQMGKPLELEDATSGTRRPASIDRVQVEVDEGSRIPQLVVSLRYDDEQGRAASLAPVEVPVTDHDAAPAQHEDAPETDAEHDHHEVRVVEHAPEPQAAEAVALVAKEEASIDEESSKLKSTFARNAAKVTPALLSWAKRAKVTAALLAAKARRGASTGDDVEIPMRRTTAPAPGGGLHTSGRKVVRGSAPEERFEEEPQPPKGGRFKITKKKAALGASIGIATILAVIALKKPAPQPQLASAPPADTTATAPAGTTPTAAVTNLPPAPANAPVAPPTDPLAAAAAAMANGGPGIHAGTPGTPGKPGKPTPFTNGAVGAHPTIIKIKMDGPVEGIQGETQPTGFTIVTPNRKVLDPATSLASKDPRLEGVRVSNEGGGAEFTVTFKDGVPNYVVRAHGDTLEMVLAKATGPGKAEASAKKPRRGKKH
jgi:hypothetical protein